MGVMELRSEVNPGVIARSRYAVELVIVADGSVKSFNDAGEIIRLNIGG